MKSGAVDSITFDRLRIGASNRCAVIGEVAQAHDGSLGMAHAFIDAIADAGADAVKFQTHLATAESTKREKWRVKFSRQDTTRYAYWKRMEFTKNQWRGLRQHARERHLTFLSSPFSEHAVRLLHEIGVPGWKIASGEMGNLPLLRNIAATKLPVLMSSGISTLDELDAAVRVFRDTAVEFALLQCTTQYPCPPERIGLNLLAELRTRYECPVGLSDHSGSIYVGLAAAALGASLLEVHVTFDRRMFGPDVSSSLTLDELGSLTQGVRTIHQLRTNPVDKNSLSQSMAPLRRLFGKGIVARQLLDRGTRITCQSLAFKKPLDGIPAGSLDKVLGRRLRRRLLKDDPVRWCDLEAPASGSDKGD